MTDQIKSLKVTERVYDHLLDLKRDLKLPNMDEVISKLLSVYNKK